jgi:YjjG family noncanonical pyrimidine nucleotidase
VDNIKAVFLDVDNTLLDFNACSRLSMEKSFNECGLPFQEHMYPVFQKVNDKLWQQIETGKLTRAQLHQIRWDLVLAELGIAGDGIAVEARFLEHLAQDATPIDGAYELLEYLYPRYTVCVASNAPYEQQLKRLRSVDMLRFFHKTFISEKMGAAKPGKEFFDACFHELSPITPEETIMIGDSVTADIRGGRTYGMHTCWYDHNHTGQKCQEAEYTVNSLRDIRGIL